MGRLGRSGIAIRFTTRMVAAFAFSGAAAAQQDRLPPTEEIERATRTVWMNRGSPAPLCAQVSGLQADQREFQELQGNFAPGQWVVRFARSAAKAQDIARFDHLAKFGFFERKETFLNVGPLQGRPAIEYQPTDAGWVLATSSSTYPSLACLYFGMRRLMKVLDYAESPKDAEGFSRVSVRFLNGVGDLERWAEDEAATGLFPSIREALAGREGTFTFHRGPEGKLRNSRSDRGFIDDIKPSQGWPAELPGIAAAREGIARLEQQEAAKTEAERMEAAKKGGEKLVRACYPLLPAHLPQLWREGDAVSAAEVTLLFGKPDEQLLAVHQRLLFLEQAGFLRLEGTPAQKKVVVRPAAVVRPIIARHGNCLPFGDARTEVAGVWRHKQPGERQVFRARYVVDKPAPWWGSVKRDLLPDVANILRHGLPFEGTTLKLREGWYAADVTDLRPTVVAPSLRAVGMAPAWRDLTEAGLAGASVVNHELHVVHSYEGVVEGSRKQGTHPLGRIDIQARKSGLPMLLLLRGYEPIDWRVRLEAGARVDAVLAVGYYQPVISGLPPRTPILALALANSGYAWDSPDIVTALGVDPASVQEAEGPKPVVVGGQQ